MRDKGKIFTISLMLGSLSLSGAAFAHGTKVHGNRTAADARMMKLHAMMPMFSLTSLELEPAIEKHDAAGAQNKARKILVAIPDLKKSRPHKNVKQIGDFKSIAVKIGEDANKIIALTEKGSFTEAQRVFRDMEKPSGKRTVRS
jgi:hypothetical protein